MTDHPMTAADQPGGRARECEAWALVDQNGEMDPGFLGLTKDEAIDTSPGPWTALKMAGWRIARVRITEIPEHGGSDV